MEITARAFYDVLNIMPSVHAACRTYNVPARLARRSACPPSPRGAWTAAQQTARPGQALSLASMMIMIHCSSPRDVRATLHS